MFAHAYFSGAIVIGNAWWVTFPTISEELELFSGPSYVTLPPIRSQIFSNQDDF
jgi:hypothetical protein